MPKNLAEGILAMRYKLTTDEVLILRDGRPFGDSGIFGGISLKWPYPQTIAGMVRTSVGLKQDECYFDQSDKREENLEKILSIGISKILPSAFLNNQWTPLMPVPADLVFTENENNEYLNVNPILYKSIEDSSGTDIKNRLWMIPSVDLRTKPAKEIPFFTHWIFFQKYLAGKLTSDTAFSFQDIGINLPIHDFRVHNAIDNNTYVTEESRLFSNNGFYMKSKSGSILIDLAIFFDVTNADVNISGDAYLGGERKRVVLTKSESEFVKIPDYFENKNFLKLFLQHRVILEAGVLNGFYRILMQKQLNGLIFQVQILKSDSDLHV